jgi:acetyl/propionyl-CoA carboxylase alpha subunit
MRYITTIGEQEFTIEIQDEKHILVDDKEYEVDFDSISEQPMYSLLLDGQSYEAYVYPSEKIWQVLLFGRFYPVHVEDERERRLRLAAGSKVSERIEYYLKAPMPGLVVNIPVTEGQEVEDGDVLVVFESMKMQNELRSPRPGRVTGLRIEEGDSVEQHTILLSVV